MTRPNRYHTVAASAWLLIWLAGCGGGTVSTTDTVAPGSEQLATRAEPDGAAAQETDSTGKDQAATQSAPAGEITLREVDADGFQSAVAAHRGKVVLVDLWATWCLPCREKFPHIVELSRQYAADGLAVISLSVDEPDNREQVLEFLRSQQATFDNLIGTYGLGSEAADAFEYGGEVPFYKLYDRSGNLRYQFSGDPRDGIEPIENLDSRIAELMAEAPPETAQASSGTSTD